MRDIEMILQRLPNAEIILTFSIDALLNFLTEKRGPSETIRHFGVDREFIHSWRQGCHDGARGRAHAQKHLMSNLRKQSGAQFFTPFLLFSTDESRTIMLAHLSRHQRARDKMLGIHWDQQNSFHHYGSGGFYELAYDPRRIDYDDDLFSFRPEDKQEMQRQLDSPWKKSVLSTGCTGLFRPLDGKRLSGRSPVGSPWPPKRVSDAARGRSEARSARISPTEPAPAGSGAYRPRSSPAATVRG